MIRQFTRYLDTHPFVAMILGAAVAFVILAAQRSLT